MNNESVEPVTEADARRALAVAGVPADGRLHKVAHQARILEALPPEVPHAGVVAFEETASSNGWC